MRNLPLIIILSVLSVEASNSSLLRGNSSLFKCTTPKDPICLSACSQSGSLPYSATFCDVPSGICFCDCRDKLPDTCIFDTESECFHYCVVKNPNQEVFLYVGGQCTVGVPKARGRKICACQCSYREDYEETNDIY